MAELLELAMKLPNENRREESKSAIVCPLTICPTRYTYGTKLDSSGTAVARNLWSHLNSKHDRSTWPLKAIPIKSTVLKINSFASFIELMFLKTTIVFTLW